MKVFLIQYSLFYPDRSTILISSPGIKVTQVISEMDMTSGMKFM